MRALRAERRERLVLRPGLVRLPGLMMGTGQVVLFRVHHLGRKPLRWLRDCLGLLADVVIVWCKDPILIHCRRMT